MIHYTRKYYNFYDHFYYNEELKILMNAIRKLYIAYEIKHSVRGFYKDEAILKEFFNMLSNGSNRNQYAENKILAREPYKKYNFDEIDDLTSIKLCKTKQRYSDGTFDINFSIANNPEHALEHTYTTINHSVDILEYFGLIIDKQKGYYYHDIKEGKTTRIWITDTIQTTNGQRVSEVLNEAEHLVLAMFLNTNTARLFFKNFNFSDPDTPVYADDPEDMYVSFIKDQKTGLQYPASEESNANIDQLNKMWGEGNEFFYYKQVYVNNENSHGRMYNKITLMNKEDRNYVLLLHGYKEFDYSAMIISILYQFMTGKTFKERIYDLYAKEYIRLQLGFYDDEIPFTNQLKTLIANELKQTFVTMFNSPHANYQLYLKSINLRKPLADFGVNILEWDFSPKIIRQAMYNVTPEIMHFFGTSTCMETVYIESQTMLDIQKNVINNNPESYRLPILVHDALYYKCEKDDPEYNRIQEAMKKFLTKNIEKFKNKVQKTMKNELSKTISNQLENVYLYNSPKLYTNSLYPESSYLEISANDISSLFNNSSSSIVISKLSQYLSNQDIINSIDNTMYSSNTNDYLLNSISSYAFNSFILKSSLLYNKDIFLSFLNTIFASLKLNKKDQEGIEDIIKVRYSNSNNNKESLTLYSILYLMYSILFEKDVGIEEDIGNKKIA